GSWPSASSRPFPYTTLFRSVDSGVGEPVLLRPVEHFDVLLWRCNSHMTLSRCSGHFPHPIVPRCGAKTHLGTTWRTPFAPQAYQDRKSTRLNSSHVSISYAV